MIQDCDFHSHSADAPVVTVAPRAGLLTPGRPMTVGVHPWDASDLTPGRLADMEQMLAYVPGIVAVGEIGLDRAPTHRYEGQEAAFVAQLELASRYNMPVVLHVVRAYGRLLELYRERPELFRRAAVHGFRGNPELARQLLSAGFWLSLGPACRGDVARLIPPDRLLVESDAPAEATPLQRQVLLNEAVEKIAAARNTSPAGLALAALTNKNKFYTWPE